MPTEWASSLVEAVLGTMPAEAWAPAMDLDVNPTGISNPGFFRLPVVAVRPLFVPRRFLAPRVLVPFGIPPVAITVPAPLGVPAVPVGIPAAPVVTLPVVI